VQGQQPLMTLRVLCFSSHSIIALSYNSIAVFSNYVRTRLLLLLTSKCQLPIDIGDGTLPEAWLLRSSLLLFFLAVGEGL